MKYDFNIDSSKKVRVILSTDAKNEADDQYAITHALLTQKIIMKGLVASHFAYKQPEGSMQASYDEIIKVLDCMDMKGAVDVFRGAEGFLADKQTPKGSDGSAFIIREALRTDDIPLFVVCIGALTDLASAYLQEPAIAKHMTAIWEWLYPLAKGQAARSHVDVTAGWRATVQVQGNRLLEEVL